jgi:hypothetical protein
MVCVAVHRVTVQTLYSADGSEILAMGVELGVYRTRNGLFRVTGVKYDRQI